MPTEASRELLRSLPQVEEVLRAPRIEALLADLPRPFVVEAVRDAVDALRRRILDGERCDVSAERVAEDAAVRALALTRPSLRRVVNASGVIVHTNLGRSPLAPSAVEAALGVAGGYSTLEYDTDRMARGSRHAHCEHLICALTGAEAAIAVNNNAAAVMMVLSEFASGHEAVVSRGELVEIGGSFRIPDIMALSRAAMVEVGTTNKTHEADYERALGPDTAMLLKVHPSNYRLIGFTESVGVRELRALADAENARREAAGAASEAPDVLVYEDQGSGALVRLDAFGAYAEPAVAESLRAGCDLVSFSGDKLLGGPQAGIVVGAKRHIDRLKNNPLARALRLDKMTLAALEATLRLYLEPERALAEIPTLRMLAEPAEDVRVRADALLGAVEAALPTGCAELDVVDEVARAGGGALPMCDIPTFCVRVTFLRGDALGCERHLVSERAVPVVGRLKKDALLLDARTVLGEDEMAEIAAGLAEYFAEVAA
ncbi:L-seryl-tRNA(Sec) selenium transferase [Gordonibacter sp. 28C]|uniref:L-seryl-tRNA(Sec) selenium transferase n=1 Tax=Gordonibacter sp. 28C TaxID=2078569 RepID=UPI000DF82CAF|nr:L-seryl-tRNA(Sec) selenium transferase [Gordonibacter sp. 28C]RDB62276.1 L-seryl-tRNA(Sec) selenium transferase [Gordonibacter sp. 28C]